MSTTYLSPIHTTIGEYRIGDPLFDTTELDTTLNNLVVSSENFKGQIAAITTRLVEVVNRLDGHADDIDFLSGVVNALNLRALKHTITDVGILRPDDAHELFLKVNVFDAAAMSAQIGVIDLSSSADWKYFKALLINNGESTTASTADPLLESYFPGTQWLDPATLDTAIKEYGSSEGFTGYNSAFNNSPVNISFLEWLKDKGLEADLTVNSRFYLRYEWYYVEDGEIHNSDHFSMVVPSLAEVGAKAGAVASKSEIYELKQALETDVTTAEYIDTDSIDDQYPATGFYANPYQCTILNAFATNSEAKKIILQDYTESKTYKLKFTTGSTSLPIASKPRTSNITFFANYSEGPEKIDALNASSVTFSANTTYLISIQLGMIQILASESAS